MTISSAARLKAATPDVDVAKVARLRTSIESGTYQVDSHAVAARLLEEE